MNILLLKICRNKSPCWFEGIIESSNLPFWKSFPNVRAYILHCCIHWSWINNAEILWKHFIQFKMLDLHKTIKLSSPLNTIIMLISEEMNNVTEDIVAHLTYPDFLNLTVSEFTGARRCVSASGNCCSVLPHVGSPSDYLSDHLILPMM